MKTEEELIWEAYNNKHIIKENYDDDYDEELAGEFYFYHKNGDQSIAEIADEYDMAASEVKEWIKQYVSSMKGDLTKKQFGLDARHEGEDISINPTKQSYETDKSKEFGNLDYEEDAIKGRSQVTDVAAKKNRPRYGLTRRGKAGEVR